MINTEAQINEEIDPQQEIVILREEIQELRKQLLLLRGFNVFILRKKLFFTHTLFQRRKKNSARKKQSTANI